MKKRIISWLLTMAILVGFIPVASITANAASVAASLTDYKLTPKIYEYSADSNQNQVAFSSFTFREEKQGSTFATGNDKKFRVIAMVYHVGEDVIIPAYSVATLSATVGVHGKKLTLLIKHRRHMPVM